MFHCSIQYVHNTALNKFINILVQLILIILSPVHYLLQTKLELNFQPSTAKVAVLKKLLFFSWPLLQRNTVCSLLGPPTVYGYGILFYRLID